jgi:hypothetical protein
MDFFVTYYKEKYAGMKFIEFRMIKGHPPMICELLQDVQKAKKAQKFIINFRNRTPKV